MEVIVLAGGFGTRLQSVVSDVPKPMADIGGKPFLEYLMSRLAHGGAARFVLSVGYKAQVIVDYFGSSFLGIPVEYEIESVPLQTGGAVRRALTSCYGDHALVCNGDTYIELNIASVEECWQDNRSSVIVGVDVPDMSRYGMLRVKGELVVGFGEKKGAGPGLINAGCYVLSADALDHFELDKAFSLESEYLLPEAVAHRLHLFRTSGMFIDIGIPDDYEKAKRLLTHL